MIRCMTVPGCVVALVGFGAVGANASTPLHPVATTGVGLVVMDLESARTAADAARADARREYVSPAAAAAAYARLERARAPLVEEHSDPRRAIWMADAAEDAITLGLAVDGCGVSTLVGLPTDTQRERTVQLLRQALADARDATAAAQDAVANGLAPAELSRRLDGVELALRIPVTRACAAILAAWAGAVPEQDATAILESAAMRLEALRNTIPAEGRPLADACLGYALARLGRSAEAEAVLAPLAARSEVAPGIRLLAIAGLIERAAPSAAGRRRALALLRDRLGDSLDDASRVTLGDLDFRLAMDASRDATDTGARAAPAWNGWIEAVERTPPSRREAARAEAMARIARHAAGLDDPVSRTARALAAVRDPARRAGGLPLLEQSAADPALAPQVRALAQLELGRAQLLEGRPTDGADTLLSYAQENPADPSSRHAIDVAVAAARGSGDAALLGRVLGTATARFPDHPDHPAWRVELAALELSPDAALDVREPASRRAARALDALDRADRGARADDALRADLAIAAADALSEQLEADEAIRALDRVAADAALPTAMADRLLEERLRALAISGRSIDADPRVARAVAADPTRAADAAARTLRRMAAVDLALLASQPADERHAQRLSALARATAGFAPATPDRDEVLSRAWAAAGQHAEALAPARRAIAARGERLDLMLTLAEALWGIGGPEALAESMGLYDRIGRAAPDGSPTWWLAQLRRLQGLERAGRSLDAIAPRVARLQARDAAMGGEAFRAAFMELAARHE
ncbi:MAG: hypothetical protein RI990_839 [Planctomycetota bacterium]